MNGLKLFPTPEEIQGILDEVFSFNYQSQQINFDLFRTIRISPPEMQNYQLTLNVLAEYTKYNCAYIHKGFITEDAIETALERENNFKYSNYVKNNLLSLCFNAQYKLVGIKELYCFMKKIVPNQWRQWICDQLQSGTSSAEIEHILVETGFDSRQASDCIRICVEQGYVSALPEYIDKCSLNVIHYIV